MPAVGPPALLRVCGHKALTEACFSLTSLLLTAECIFSNMPLWPCQLHSLWDPNKHWLLSWDCGFCFQADSACLLEPDFREMQHAISMAGWQLFKHFLNLIQTELTSGTAYTTSASRENLTCYLHPGPVPSWAFISCAVWFYCFPWRRQTVGS